MARKRLDQLVVERGLAETRAKAQALILAARVRVDGKTGTKAGTAVDEGAAIEVDEPEHPWVSRGGIKLAAALDAFGIDPSGRTCLDVGASTGGFTDVLVSRGAARVYSVDVGYGQLHAKLRTDPRVVVVERVNARNLGQAEVPEPVSLAVADLSFISLVLVIPAIAGRLAPQGEVVLLVKPQFEAERGEVGKGGIVRDEAVRQRAVERIRTAAAAAGWEVRGVIPSPITGMEGNVEYLIAATSGECRRPVTSRDASR